MQARGAREAVLAAERRRGEEGEKRDERGVDLQHLAQVEEIGQVLPRIVAACQSCARGWGGKGEGRHR